MAGQTVDYAKSCCRCGNRCIGPGDCLSRTGTLRLVFLLEHYPASGPRRNPRSLRLCMVWFAVRIFASAASCRIIVRLGSSVSDSRACSGRQSRMGRGVDLREPSRADVGKLDHSKSSQGDTRTLSVSIPLRSAFHPLRTLPFRVWIRPFEVLMLTSDRRVAVQSLNALRPFHELRNCFGLKRRAKLQRALRRN